MSGVQDGEEVRNFFRFQKIWRNVLPSAAASLFRRLWVACYPQQNADGSYRWEWTDAMGEIFMDGSPLEVAKRADGSDEELPGKLEAKALADGSGCSNKLTSSEDLTGLLVKGQWLRVGGNDVRVKDVFNIRTGPFPKDRSEERKLSGVCVVELSNSDVQRMVLQRVKSQNLVCKIGGHAVDIKAGMTESATQRDKSLRAAEKLLKEDTRCSGKTVTIVWRENRGVTVDGVYAYDQPKGREVGGFVAPYADLCLP